MDSLLPIAAMATTSTLPPNCWHDRMTFLRELMNSIYE
jgi:hypothetical protein